MPNTHNTQRLRDLMEQYNVTPREVAGLLNRTYKTVLAWRSVSDQTIPDNMLDLLELKLASRKG